MQFENRAHAGAALAERLQPYRGRPEVIVLALPRGRVPVGAPPTCHDLSSEVDEVICAATPEFFFGVGQFYADFRQTTDDEVRQLLDEANKSPTVRPDPGPSSH